MQHAEADKKRYRECKTGSYTPAYRCVRASARSLSVDLVLLVDAIPGQGRQSGTSLLALKYRDDLSASSRILTQSAHLVVFIGIGRIGSDPLTRPCVASIPHENLGRRMAGRRRWSARWCWSQAKRGVKRIVTGPSEAEAAPRGDQDGGITIEITVQQHQGF